MMHPPLQTKLHAPLRVYIQWRCVEYAGGAIYCIFWAIEGYELEIPSWTGHWRGIHVGCPSFRACGVIVTGQSWGELEISSTVPGLAPVRL